jgi:hypothetical protein
MCIYIYVHLHVCMYVYVWMDAYLYIYVCTYMNRYVCMYVYIHKYIYPCISYSKRCVHIYAAFHTEGFPTYTFLNLYKCVYMYIKLYIYINTYIGIHIFIIYICTSIYIGIASQVSREGFPVDNILIYVCIFINT